MIDELQQLVSKYTKILIIQADNPDGDSLGSALALETILESMGKQTRLFCSVDMPGYLKYLSGWDRVSNDTSSDFELSIIVDASTMTLLEKMKDSGMLETVASKPCIVLDHHQSVENVIPFTEVIINDTSVSSTGELIYNIAKELNWPLDDKSGNFIMSAVLGDTQGLSNSLTSPQTYRLMADLTELGVERSVLEDRRREYSKMPPEIFYYKAKLIERTELLGDGKLALITIPHEEIIEFSPLYNPAPLIQTDMLQTIGVGVAIVIKLYKDGKVLGAIRSNSGYDLAAKLAEQFGGGGHAYASGFKMHNVADADELKNQLINQALKMIIAKESDNKDENIQYTYTTD